MIATLLFLGCAAHQPSVLSQIPGLNSPPHSMAAVCGQAQAKRRQHRHAEAVVLYERGQDGHACDPIQHANSLRHLGRGEEAAALRLSVLLNAPRHQERELHLPANEARVWRKIARDHQVAGNLDQAWQAADMAEGLKPDSDA